MSSSIDEQSRRLLHTKPGVENLKEWLMEASGFIKTLHTNGIHCWCKHSKVCVLMIKQLHPHIKVGRGSVEKVDNVMQWSLSECVECIRAYNLAKQQVPADIRDICIYLDCQRLEKATPKMTWCFELLRFIGPLSDQAVNAKFIAFLKTVDSRNLCASGVFAGVYQLLGHHDEEIRQLVWQHHMRDIETEMHVDCLEELLVFWKNLLQGGMQSQSPFVPQDRPVYFQQMPHLWKGLLGIMSKTKGQALAILLRKHPEFIACAIYECSKDPSRGAGAIDSAIQCVRMFLEGLGAETFSVCKSFQPSSIFEILISLVSKLDKSNLQKAVLCSMVYLAKACISTPSCDHIHFRTVHFLLIRVWDNPRSFLPPIRGYAVKEGLELVEFAWSMKKRFTKAGHLYGLLLERLLVKKELIGDPSASFLIHVLHPATARLASNIIMVDACVLAATMSAYRGRMCITMDSLWTGIPLELSSSAFSSLNLWICVPLIWEKMAWCNCDSPTMSKISAGFLVAGAALSQIEIPEIISSKQDVGGSESGGGFLRDPLDGLSGGSNEKWQTPETMEACRGQVTIRGNEAALLGRLLKAIGLHLDGMAHGSAEQLCSEDRGKGWRGLILVCTGVHPTLREQGLRVAKLLASSSGALASEEVVTALVEGCQVILDDAGKKVWPKDLLDCLAPLLRLLTTVTGCSSGQPKKLCSRLLELIRQVWATGIRAICCTDDLLAVERSPEEMKGFFSFQETLWDLKMVQAGVCPATLSEMEVWLVELLSLGPRLNGASATQWAGLLARILGEVPDNMALPESVTACLRELAASPDLGGTFKFLLQRSLSRLVPAQVEVKVKSPPPSACDPVRDEGAGTSIREGGAGPQGVTGGGGSGSSSGGVGTSIGQVAAPARGVNPASLENLWSGFDRAKLVTARRPETSGPKRERSPKGVDQKTSTPDEDSDDGLKFTQGGYKIDGKIVLPTPGGARGEAPKGIKRIELNATDHRMIRKAGNRNKSAKPLFTIDTIQQQYLSWDIEKLDSPELTWRDVNTIPSVPDKFASMEQYGRIFRGLLLEELRADMQQQWEELKQRNSRPMSKSMTVVNVQRISDLYNISFSYHPDERLFFRPDDLLLFASRQIDFKDRLPSQRCTGIIKSVGSTFETDGKKTVEVRIHFKGGAIGSQGSRTNPSSFVRKGWQCQAVVLMNLLTHTREFQALCNLPSLPTPLVNQIINPLPPVAVPLTLERTTLATNLCMDLQEKYNESQQKAIASAVAGKGHFSLVQGPPGTGKTSGIIGMISGLLHTLRIANLQSGEDSQSNQEYFRPNRRRKFQRGPTSPAPAVRILICAQSNAAIDELISRISVGELMCGSGKSRVPSMVRMGRMVVTHSSVQPYHIDALCDKEMEINEQTAEASRTTNESKKKLEKTMAALEEAKSELSKAENRGGVDDNAMNALKDKVRQMQGSIGRIRSEIRSGRQTMEQAKRSLRLGVVRDAELVFSTLSSAAGDLASLCNSGSVAKHISFDALIVDEAAQALEPSTLVPLKLLKPSARVVLVGDPRQLPPTVFSSVASGKNFGQSLFERFEKAGYPVEVLSEQYRMHPKISRFPSKYFYRDRLIDGSGISEETRRAPFHDKRCFSPFVFFDCAQGRENRGHRNRGSIENPMEADLVAMLFAEVKTRYKEDVGKVAIIAPYKAQVDRIKRCLENQPMLIKMRGRGQAVADLDVEVATVDSFQGREADIVIISLVRAQDRSSGSGTVGFLDDARRMNVALTRARRSLWVVGHGETLKACKAWNAFIDHAEETGCRITAQTPFRSLLDAADLPKPSAPRLSGEKIAEFEAMFEQQRKMEQQAGNPIGIPDQMEMDEKPHVQLPTLAQAWVPKPTPSRKRERERSIFDATEIDEKAHVRLFAPPQDLVSKPAPSRKRERERSIFDATETDKLVGPPKKSKFRAEGGNFTPYDPQKQHFRAPNSRPAPVEKREGGRLSRPAAERQPPSSVFGAPEENARKSSWMKRFGVDPSKEKNSGVRKPTSRPTTPATSGQSKSRGGKPSRGPSPANDEGGFDIADLLGSVVQSNSRPRAFHGHNAGTLGKK
ncbi:hypothetical protein BSKO_00847 [Bryopsis sp. KO-2023]|nr:hypothetical protein BSKO_00847 [Bryopsis sp. KO-2023]